MSRGRVAVDVPITPAIRKMVAVVKRAERDIEKAETQRREAVTRRLDGIAAMSATGMTNRQIGELIGTTGEAVRVALHRNRNRKEKT
ncbi:hypothetical protein ABQE48_16545 [Mycolicibacterium thermoresistibile]